MKKLLRKSAALTDIHWGCKSNSEQHNKDCDDYINWFCDQVKSDPTIDSIIFLGDWFENRSALNILTMNYSYIGAKKLNDLGIPVYFIIGNHDLYHRHTREMYSTINFHEFNNFVVINTPTIIAELGDGVLLCPYLFHDEYPSLKQYTNLKTWWGHFEFKGFQVTGSGMLMPSGPDAAQFVGPKRIFSGHFHKRQISKNVVYIGNTFPTNFADVDDGERGMMIYDHTTDDVEFVNWDECPRYTKTTLTKLLDNEVTLYPRSRVKCLIDVPLTFEECGTLSEKFVNTYQLREFNFEESSANNDAISDTVTDIDVDVESLGDVEVSNLDDLVILMLGEIDAPTINNSLLVEQYKKLSPQ